jgi:hypothetical protein
MTKPQGRPNDQTPSLSHCALVIPWSLGFGHWSFPSRALGDKSLKVKHSHFQTHPDSLPSGMKGNPMKTLSLIILTASLGAGCGKQENAEAGKPKPPPTQPKVTEKPKPPPSQPKVAKPKPLPPALVAAWEKAGFEAGWMGIDKYSRYIGFTRTLNELDASKAVPTFKARNWKPGVLESLPAPATAFGLDLMYSDITDADLKEVAKLQKLTELDLTRCTQITDAGVAELQKALPKCEIDH